VARSIYITSAEGHTGKSTIALGVLDALMRVSPRVGVFRPITRSLEERDAVLDVLLAHDGVQLDAADCIGVTYDDVRRDPEAALVAIVARFKAVEAQCDAVIVVGSDYTDVAAPAELGFNARIAANLGVPVLLVLSGRDSQDRAEQLGTTTPRTPDQVQQIAALAVAEIAGERAELFAMIVNRAAPDALAEIAQRLDDGRTPVWAIPEERSLVAPSMRVIMNAVDGRLVRGGESLLEREAYSIVIAGMSMVNVLPRLTEGSVVVIAADRTETLLATLLAAASGTFPDLAGIVLNGPFPLPETILQLIDGFELTVPIVATDLGTYDTAVRIMGSRGRMSVESRQRHEIARALFQKHVDVAELTIEMGLAHSAVVTPLMFQYGLIERARRQRKRIVLPEGDDDRILQAAAVLLTREVADLIILGDEGEIRARAGTLGLDLAAAQVLSPTDPELVGRFAAEYARLRAHKGITVQQAADTVTDVSYFGTMMVHLGLADGMVSGAAHTTAHTIRPAFEIIRTRPGVEVVSSVFLMALADRVLVYGDCAVIPDPTSAQLADIALSSAATARGFGIDPRVAMLSYSTGESGSGADVEKVREATALVRQRMPELPVEGPIQYDAAADAAVAKTKLPDSAVAGRATVFVFPDLNTGNNTYKAVQRSAGAVAIGPVLQGLNKPINDLSRGALVDDIVNTVAITAIQAQGDSA